MHDVTEVFRKYPNDFFIETGSFIGDAINSAIITGFQTIISIELADKYYNIAKNRFKDNNSVTIYQGESHKLLPNILKNIDTNITFWLDGHHSGGDTGLGEYWAPLMQELDAIKNHHIKTHTIIIDDMRCWKDPNPVHGFYQPDIIDKLININSDYILTYEDGFAPKDILVAHMKK